MKKYTILPNVEIQKYIVVLYSHEQDCFHIEDFIEYVKENFKEAMFSNFFNGYQIIGLVKSDIEANEYIEHFKKLKQNKDERINTY